MNVSNSEESKLHGGEIGQLLFKMYGLMNDKEISSDTVALNSGGYHQPGVIYTALVAANEVPSIKYVEVEWNYQTNVFNPLTWRIIASPRIYITEVTVRSLETRQT